MTNGGRYNRVSGDARRMLCIDNPFLWTAARRIDYPVRTMGGRPNRYPLWVFFLWMILVHEYGSSRRVEEALSDTDHGPWRLICENAQRELGADRPDLVPPEVPPTRNQFNYALSHHLPAHAGIIAETIRTMSRQLAVALGLGTEGAPGSINRPSVQRVAYGDVTVMTARTRRLAADSRHVDPETGEVVYRRHDKDAARHTTGGGTVVQGLPWAFTHIRGPQRNQQVILAVDPLIPGGRSEGHLVVDQYLNAASGLPGLVGYAYDRALRGQHLDRLLKAGHIGFVGVYRSKGTKRDRYHGLETHHPNSGPPRSIEIHLVGGTPHTRSYDVDGNPLLQPLRRRRINMRTNRRDGIVRLSAEYDVTDPATGHRDGYVRIRLDQTPQDRLVGYNRPEHLRAFPEDDPAFIETQRPLRGSAESANRLIDDHLPRERLHHFGFEKNQLSMLAWQVYRNAQTRAVFARHLHPEPTEDLPPVPPG